MARPLRVEYPGAVYHVTSRGNERKTTFKDNKDRNIFLETVQRINHRYNFICHAYCLMGNHYHLLIETPDGNLSKGMRQFTEKRRSAEKKYREFVNAGIGRESIWKEVRGQSLLGKEDFVDSLLGIVKGHEEIQEIPRSQRYLSRPDLDKLFSRIFISNRGDLITAIKNAVYEYGYTQKQIADHLGIHYSTVSRMVNAKNKT